MIQVKHIVKLAFFCIFFSDSNEPKATSDNVANECLTEFGGKVNYCTNCNDNNVGTVQCEVIMKRCAR